MFSFGGKKKDPEVTAKEQTRKWQKEIRGEMRRMDRSIREIERSERKAKDQIKQAAKRGDTASLKIMAKELVRSKKAKERIHTSKATLNSLNMKMAENLAMVKVTNAFESSTAVMRQISSLVKVPQISATMREMAMEMEKAGLIEEMVEDAMEAVEPDDLEDEADEEVDKLLFEITAGKFGAETAVPTHSLEAAPAPAVAAAAAPAPAAPVAVGAGGDDGGLSDLQARLEGL